MNDENADQNSDDTVGEPDPSPDEATHGDGQDDDTEDGRNESRPEAKQAPADHRFTRQSIGALYTYINMIGGSVSLGLVNNLESPEAMTSGAVTGQMSEAEIRALRNSPVRSMTHEEAVATVRRDGVAAVYGPPGCGKSHGGRTVLASLGSGPVFVLTPGTSLEELSRRPYQEKCAYFVEGVNETGDRLTTDDVWRRVRTRVTEQKAWLLVVITAEMLETNAAEAVRHLRWERPDVRLVLEAYGLASATVETVLGELPDTPGVGSVARVAERVAAGTDPATAVREVFEFAARARVAEWFDGKPSRKDICVITVLAMTHGLQLRDHGMCLLRFEEILDKHIPRPEEKDAADVVLDRRSTMVRGDGLVTLDRIMKDGMVGKQLRFKDPSYRPHVLRELWDSYDERFLFAVHEWVHEVVLDDTVRFNLTVGLAVLAREAYEEVELDYLLPWSKGAYGWQGQQAAIWVLSLMSTDQELSRTALQTARRWIGHGSWPQRWTGAVAFTGQLGVRYPEEAARRLWQLVAQEGPISQGVAQSMGELFATLVVADGRAVKVITLLQRRLDELSPAGRAAGRYRLAMRAVLAVLSTKLRDGGNPAVVVLLLAKPELRAPICRIWAAALRYTPARRGALRSLAQALRGIERLSDDAEANAAALGGQLRLALSPTEQSALRRDLPVVLRKRSSGRERPSPLTKILLAALDAAAPPSGSES
ncbi:ATP-binding protein [Actinomadura rayongensis]|uniref:Uncharacterized protein n=1 Tax=Actinomadura rayongensis TaxID=1429076 RepID=A0A6I4W5T2_9ACTN|nr:ATP-binding protein [Actinomadura rayongensis]MXQ64868.1 hypothetical protein [Actinomadura rayongensis]